MSHHPSYTLGALCLLGGVAGFARRRSLPSLIAGGGVGALYGYAGYRIQNGQRYGYEIATAASTVLVVAGARRFRLGPVPKVLTATGLTGGLYYGKKTYDFGFGA